MTHTSHMFGISQWLWAGSSDRLQQLQTLTQGLQSKVLFFNPTVTDLIGNFRERSPAEKNNSGGEF